MLSACSTANARVLHGGSLLGLSAALITLGVGNVVAPLVPISDRVVGRRDDRGAPGDGRSALPPAEALACASGTPGVGRATAGAFVALGA